METVTNESTPVVESTSQPDEDAMFKMQLEVLKHFRTFFSKESVSAFDIALQNMEISRLVQEVELRDKIIEDLNEKIKK